MPENYFSKFAKINVNEHVEKKGKFSYLSWAWAVSTLRKEDPAATWEVKRFDGLPYMKTDCGFFVEVAVTVQGITLSQIHPVLDNNNRPIEKPNSFQINTSIQRCLVKAISLHGLGIYIYSGEDVPEGEEELPAQTANLIPTLKAKWQALGNAADKFEDWYQSQKIAGANDSDLNTILTKKMAEKNAYKKPEEPQKAIEEETKKNMATVPVTYISDKQASFFRVKAKEAGYTSTDFLKDLGINSSKEIPAKRFNEILEFMKNNPFDPFKGEGTPADIPDSELPF